MLSLCLKQSSLSCWGEKQPPPPESKIEKKKTNLESIPVATLLGTATAF